MMKHVGPIVPLETLPHGRCRPALKLYEDVLAAHPHLQLVVPTGSNADQPAYDLYRAGYVAIDVSPDKQLIAVKPL